ncbi:MAG: LAGLIDADG family homing endonuclease, partial [Fimbriiglobus sp.]
MFATDGWATVTAEGYGRIGFATVSERLARQVHHLLLRFGVIARLRERAVKYRGTRRPAWQLDVTDPASVRAFAADIGMFGKEPALARAAAAARTGGRKMTRDTIPAAVWEELSAAKGAESWARLAERAGLPSRSNLHVGRRGLSRGRLRTLAAAVGSDPLLSLADSEVYWDEIVAI